MQDNSRILDLRHHISKLEPVVSRDILLADENPDDFALQFAAKMNQSALNKRKAELVQLIHESHKEYFEVRLTGSKIGKGTAPIFSVAEFLEKLQKLYDRISQSIVYGPRECGQIQNTIKDISSLQLEAVAPGSFKMTLSGNVPHCGIFDGIPEEVSKNVFTKSTDIFFEAMESNDPEIILDTIAPLGGGVVSSFKDFLQAVVNHELNIDSSWISISGKQRCWQHDHHSISSLVASLDQVDEPLTETEELTGWFINIHSEKNKFEFRISGDTTIKGNFPEEIKPTLRMVGVNPLENKVYTAQFSKEIYRNKLEKSPKILWTLLSIR